MQSLSQIPMSYKEALENLEESKVREALKNLRNSCKTVVQLFLTLLLLSLRWKSLPVSSARTLLLLPFCYNEPLCHLLLQYSSYYRLCTLHNCNSSSFLSLPNNHEVKVTQYFVHTVLLMVLLVLFTLTFFTVLLNTEFLH